MFEDSLMESQNRLSSPNQRWTTLASLAFQCTIAAGMIALPLLHPDVLHLRADPPTITLPLKPPMPRVPHLEATRSTNTSFMSTAMPAPGTPVPKLRNLGSLNSTVDDTPPSTSIGSMSGPGEIPGVGISPSGTGTRVTLAPAPAAGPIHISRGVSAGLLLAPIRPVYPPIAISTRTEGVVIIEAIISKSGHIESAHATSGPPLLRSAALEAIRSARCSPYLLNGQPTEVETTITVNFKLAG
jgi:protein TonB